MSFRFEDVHCHSTVLLVLRQCPLVVGLGKPIDGLLKLAAGMDLLRQCSSDVCQDA